MKSRVNFHLLSKWSPILRAKLRKRLGGSRIPALSSKPAPETLKELGLSLGAFRRHASAYLPSEARIDRFFGHQFRVLGTEWQAPAANSDKLVYQPIDWKPHYGGQKGEDIKLPWELSRFHGFAEMAYYAQGKDSAEVRRIAVEILNQLRDFSSANPLGAGAHWGCAMDVSLRALNIVVALELLRAAGWAASTEEKEFLARTIRDHGRFVFRNLEWYRVGRGNHYLADLVGLLACSVWLSDDRETSAWLGFAAQELEIEAQRQFLEDGSNFEGSVFYHRLSLELVALGYALLEGPARVKKAWKGKTSLLAGRLLAGLAFLHDMTDGRGHGVQLGDHDSGRALKIHVPEIELDGRVFEDALATSDTLSLRCLFHKSEPAGALGEVALWIAGKTTELPAARGALRVPVMNGQEQTPAPGAIQHNFSIPEHKPGELEFGYYENFGVYFWKSKSTEIWLRCGSPSEDGHYGHAHFDQLHLELRINGKPEIFDPGSYSYTGNIELRNFYRGPQMHFIPRLPERESLADPSVDTFRYPGLPMGECLSANTQGFCGRYQLGGQTAYRKMQISSQTISVWDWAEGGTLLSRKPAPESVSWGYGEQIRWPIAGVPQRNGK